MNEKPITLNANEVRAVIEGRKTQMRVVAIKDALVNKHYTLRAFNERAVFDRTGPLKLRGSKRLFPPSFGVSCPFGKRGDRLWVRETFGVFGLGSGNRVFVGYRERLPKGKTLADTDGGLDIYAVDQLGLDWATKNLDSDHWQPARRMPRWASRLTLGLVDVRVERLHAISARDCVAEGTMLRRWIDEDQGNGIPFWDKGIERDGLELQATFRNDWDSLHPKNLWPSNAWVWVLGWKKL